jgi:hypothetical protein
VTAWERIAIIISIVVTVGAVIAVSMVYGMAIPVAFWSIIGVILAALGIDTTATLIKTLKK